MSLLVVCLVDRSRKSRSFVYHYARPGHVNALCGEERITNGDSAGGLLATCETCILIAGTNGEKPECEPSKRSD